MSTEDILVIDNLIDLKGRDTIEKSFFNSGFSWFLSPGTVEPEYLLNFSSKYKDYSQFTHTFYRKDTNLPSGDFGAAFEILNKGVKLLTNQQITQNEIIRIKANLITQQSKKYKNKFGIPHLDEGSPGNYPWIMIYYVNDSDGDTTIFNETYSTSLPKEFTVKTTIPPKKGRAVFFYGNRYHCGSPPLKSKYRAVINYNFILNNLDN